MGSEDEQELEDRWWFGLRGRVLKSVDEHEFDVVLRFSAGPVLTIGGVASVQRRRQEPEVAGVVKREDGGLSASDDLLSLTGQQVLSGVGFKTGALRLVFETGAMLTVAPDGEYEPWRLSDASGRRWVSLPGGGLATLPGTLN